jgi:hypothetical protein
VGDRPVDMYSQRGATYLAYKIKEYWLSKGYLGIETWIDPVDTPALHRDYWQPKSNVGSNGFPPGKRADWAAAA